MAASPTPRLAFPLDELIFAIAALGVPSRPDAPLSEYTTFQLGGPCPLLVDCTMPAQVALVVRQLLALQLPYQLIGGGSNLLMSDAGLPAVVVRFASATPAISFAGDQVTVSGGTALDALALATVQAGRGGLVKTSGIPGTVGGAIVGNAGAWGWQVADALTHVRLLERDGREHLASASELAFTYRNSALKTTGAVVLEATFTLPAASPADLAADRADILRLRHEKHPDLRTAPCAGSFFRNLEPTSAAARRQAAGFFLEQVGAKDMQVGGAAIFPKHANIIIKARPDCRAQDVLDLSLRMAAAVKERFGIELHREVLVTGEFRWDAAAG